MTERRVYFVRPVGMDGPIKIGTSVDIQARLGVINSQSRVLCEVMASAPGGYEEERALQKHLLGDWLRSEWFSPSLRLMAIVDHVIATGQLPPIPDNQNETIRSAAVRRAWVARRRNAEAVPAA